MALKIEKWLSTLHGILREPDSSRTINIVTLAKETISNIWCDLEEDYADHKTGLVYSHLFYQKNGILSFIQLASEQKVLGDHVVIPALILIKNVVESNKYQIWKHVKKIQDFCWNLWRNTEALSQKEIALEILLLIVTLYPGFVDLTLVKIVSVEVLRIIQEMAESKPQVLQMLYHMLGVSVKNFPDTLSSINGKIFAALVDGLEIQIDEGGDIVIAGCFKAICDYLESFPLSPPKEDIYEGNNSLYLKELGEYERRWIVLTSILREFLIDSYKSNAATQACMKFLIEHGSYVSKYLISIDNENCRKWNKALVKWAGEEIFSEYKLAEAALESFYHEISLQLSRVPKDSNPLIKEVRYMRQYIGERMMFNVQRATIKSLGYFATLLKVIEYQNEIEEIFSYLIKHCERMSFRHPDEFPASLLMLPVYVEAISRVFGNLEEISIEHMVILQKLSINLIENIPAFHSKWHNDCLKSVIMISYSLSKKPILQQIYLENLLLQALIISSTPLTSSSGERHLKLASIFVDDMTISKNYLIFWKELFTNPKSSVFRGIPDEDYANTVNHILAILLKAALKVIEKLDLRMITNVDEKSIGGPFGSGYEKCDTVNIKMANPKDLQIIANLVLLLSEIISVSHSNMPTGSFCWFMKRVIYFSEKNPLISEFYKLLSSCLSYCTLVNYFEVSACTSEEDVVRNQLLNKVVWHLKNILPQVNRFDNDLLLLFSQLEFFLTAPMVVVKHLIRYVSSPIQTVFMFGFKYPHLVLMGLEALEKWTIEVDWNELYPILNQILPSLNHLIVRSGCWNKYLGMKFSKNAEHSCSHSVNNMKPFNCQIQEKILSFLAKLPPACILKNFSNRKMITTEFSPAWNVMHVLRFTIPYPNMQAGIALDKILPHIVQLSLNSSNGKVRSTANELLFSILMLHFEEVKGVRCKQGHISEFAWGLIPSLLQLASDSDAAVGLKFHQLLLHFSALFSSKHHLEAKTYILWIDCLMDGLSHPHNTDIRRISGIYLKTLTVACSKEVMSQESLSEVVGTIVEKICTFSQHSSHSKRVGASLAINCLYSTLCDNPFILDQFWMELLYYQVLALEENESAISKMYISTSLQQLAKVIQSASNIFNKPSMCRKKPPAFEGDLLKDAIFWILKKCGSVDSNCRRESMALYLSLAPFVEGYHSPKDFITLFFEKEGAKEVIDILEGFNGLLARPPWIPDTFHSLQTCSRSDLTSLTKWLNCLYSSLDCYIWCFNENLCDPLPLFENNANFKIFDALSTFLGIFKNICMSIVIESSKNSVANACFKDDMEMVQIIGTLENVFAKIMEYLCRIIVKCKSEEILLQNLGNSWILRIMDIISIYCFEEPLRQTAMITKEIEFVFKGFVKLVKKYLSLEIYQSLLRCLADSLSKSCDVPQSDPENIFSCEVSDNQINLARNLLFLYDCHLLRDIMKDVRFSNFMELNFLKSAFNSLFRSHYSGTFYIELSESKLLCVEAFLKSSFLMDSQVKNILAIAFDETEVEGLYSQKSMAKGEYFYLSFKSCLLTSLSSNLQITIENLLEHLKTERGEETLSMWRRIWEDLFSDEKAKIMLGEESLVSSILSYIGQLLPWAEGIFIRKLTLLRALLSLPLNVLNQESWMDLEDLGFWCIDLLSNQTESLIIKAKVLRLISFFNHQKYEERLSKALQCLIEKYFSSFGDLRNINGAAGDIILKSTLLGLENMCNTALLRFFVKASSGRSCIQIDHLKKSLTVMMKKIVPGKQFEAISSIYSLSSNYNSNSDIPIETLISSVKNFLKPLIEVGNLDAVKNFFAANIKDIVKILQEGLEIASISLLKPQLVSKIISFHLMEIMFQRFGKTLEIPSCPISVAYNDGNPNNKELIKELVEKGFNARKTMSSQVIESHDLFRQYRCAAFSFLMVVMSSLKAEEKFYLIFFEETLDCDSLIWEGLIDTSTEIILSRSLEKRTAQLYSTNIEEAQASNGGSDGMESDNGCDNFSDISVDDISLLEMKRYDFCDCSVRSESWSLENAVGNLLSDQALAEKYIEDVHNHDCFVKLCGLIEHMVKKDITPLRTINEDISLPVWVRCIKKTFEDRDKHRNVKIFLMAVVLNCEKFYAPYAEHLLAPIMECVANGDFELSVNHLLENVVELILSWSANVSVPVSGENASKLLEIFFMNQENLEKEKFEHYLCLVRSIIRRWHNVVEIHQEKMLELLKFNVERYKQVEFGLLVCCILMEHSVIPWKEPYRDRFLNILLQLLDNNHGGIQMASACLTGLVLRQMDREGKGLDNEENFFAAGVLKSLSTRSATHKDNFLMCLNEIQKNYFNIIDKFLPEVLYQVPKLNGNYRTICLEMISRGEIAENPFIRLKEAGLISWLDTVISRDQEIALSILKRNLSKFLIVELREVVNHLFHFHHHTNANCRRTMYEILIYICKKYGKDIGTDKTDNLWLKKSEGVLLLGFVDEDPTITDMVSSFWKEKGSLGSHNTPVEYLVSILLLVFNPDTEKYFVEIIISLLLLLNPLQEKEQHMGGNKEPISGCLSSKKTFSSPLKQAQVIRPTPKDWQRNKGPNEMRNFLRKDRETRRQHQREEAFESHRSYRVSDVQQGHQKILFLLKALTKDDPVAGRLFLVSLMDGILETAMRTHDNSSKVWTDLNLALNRILREASSLSSCFIGAILEFSVGKHDFIKLDNEIVVLAGEAASLSPLASLYLESKLINQPLRLKTRILNEKREAKSDADLWIWLSKLYKHMGEDDVVCGILLDCLNPREEFRKALEFERTGCWMEAMSYFQEVLNLSENGNFIFEERDFYHEGYFRCLANLSQWEQLNREAYKQLDGSFSRIWDSQKSAENLFPWVFASSVRIELEYPGKSMEFFDSVCSWMNNEDRKNYMKAYFSKDLAAVYFLSGEWDLAKYFIRNSFDTFLQEWSYFLQGSGKQKMVTALLDIQLLMEQSIFLSVFDSPQKDLIHFEKLSSSWMLAPVSHLEPLDHWEKRIAFRNCYFSRMKEAINCRELGDSWNLSTNIAEISGRMNQNLIETAIAARNYHVTKKYLKKSELALRTNSDPRLRFPWHLSYGKMSAILADEKPCSSPKKVASYMKSVYVLGELLKDPELYSNPNLKISIYGEVFVGLKNLTAVAYDHQTFFDSVDDEKRKRFCKCIKYSAESQSLMEKITEYGGICIGEAIGIAETLTEKLPLSKFYLSLAKYCLDLTQYSSGNVDEICLKAFLRAILCGSNEARDWFPRLLLFDYSKSTLREIFKYETSHIPTWMFLGWTNQIISHLNGSVDDALGELVIKLCETYPAAILIPYRLNLDNNGETVSRMMLNKRINKILSKYKTTEELIYSLKYVCHPGTILNYHLDKIISFLDSPKPKIYLAKEACSLMMKEIFPSAEEKRFQGTLYEKLQIYKEMLVKSFGIDFHQVEDVKSARSIVASLISLKKEITRKDFSASLESYSYWLAKFRISDHMDVVEIPGQYSGDNEPLPDLHTKICGFSSTVPLLKNSLDITILGTDGREHRFLIEYGKDLRLDQRVGQILHIMKKCLLDDLQSIKRDLRLDINQFIPLSSHHGMIKWDRNFISLDDVITLSVKEKEIQQRKNALDQYYRWVKKISKTDDTLISIYRNLFLYGSRDETVSNYEKLIQAVPCDILRRSFLKLSQSLEDFYCLRNSFATSYAVECIAHWLLGVGKCDHRNTVMHCAYGRVSCIDLGRSFGSTVYSFSVPELMPFRLTPQILGLMQPFEEIGFMKEAMVNTLRALQGRHDIILSVMTVMVGEPSVDWLINFQMGHDIGKSTELVGSSKWNAKEIMRITQRKFIGGFNPASITRELLDVRINDDALLKEKIKDVVRGDLNHNIRAVVGDEGLSCEQQVSCLIDMATDYHILGKALVNWGPKLKPML